MLRNPRILLEEKSGQLTIRFAGPAIGNTKILANLHDEISIAECLPYLQTLKGQLLVELPGENVVRAVNTDKFPQLDNVA